VSSVCCLGINSEAGEYDMEGVVVGERCQEEPHLVVNYTLDVEDIDLVERCQVLIQELHIKGVKQAVGITGNTVRQ
jgi:hypothetical protein